MHRFIAFILGLELFSIFGIDFLGLKFLFPIFVLSMVFLAVSAVILLVVTPEQSAKLNLNKPFSFLDIVCWFFIFTSLTFAVLHYGKIGHLLKTAWLFLFSVLANFVYFLIGLFLLVVFLSLLFIVGNSSPVSKADSDSDSFFSPRNDHTSYSSSGYSDSLRHDSHTDYSVGDDDSGDSD